MTARLLLAAILMTFGSGILSAQITFDVGVATLGEDFMKAGGEFEEFVSGGGDSVTYDQLSGEIGFFGRVGYKHPVGLLRIGADVAYLYVQNSEVVLTSYQVNQDTSVTGTFEVGTSVIPISGALEVQPKLGPAKPYVGIYPTYSIVSRTYTTLNADQSGVGFGGIENRSAGENEFGLGFGTGIEFAVGPVGLGVGVRYIVANLLTQDDGEDPSNYLMMGAGLTIGGGIESDE